MKYELLVNINPLGIDGELLDEKNQSQQLHVAFDQNEFANSVVEMDAFLNAVHAFLHQLELKVAETDEISAINFKNIMHGWLALDENFEAVSPIMLGDQNDEHFIEALMMNGIGGQLQRKTGVPLAVTSPLIMTLHLRNDNPEIYAKAQHYMTLNDYIVYRLFGKNVTDAAVAARTGLYNVATQDWDGQALALTGVTKEQLPTLLPHDQLVNELVLTGLPQAINQETNFKMD
ncbi:gluconokinase [Weissella uvarum]|uniref:FGGY family carbohydrate kinase n=1 Tax=Weissella uvarum TaxID=1479233 RepID=UPI00195F2FFF|nr:FGGY family carbohydrate kinase [Weissella uvarum]MBM7617591.1 gluconokinase [Weissella uvarum]MCM0595943.1 gluconate kinase [Weissella uvarum]